MYSLGDGAKNAKDLSSISKVTRITRSTAEHFVERRWPGGFHPLRKPSEVSGIRAPGSDKWQQISWEEAFDRTPN